MKVETQIKEQQMEVETQMREQIVAGPQTAEQQTQRYPQEMEVETRMKEQIEIGTQTEIEQQEETHAQQNEPQVKNETGTNGGQIAGDIKAGGECK
jgi:hypothetical protein